MSETENSVAKLDDAGLSRLDEQINEARRRKTERGEESAEASEQPKKRAGRKALSEEEKAARDAERERVRAEKRAEREALRAQRNAEKAANAKPAHMAKVEKAAELLPSLSDAASQVYGSIRGRDDVSLTDVESLIAHLNHYVRSERTRQALESQVSVGQVVTIVGGDPRFIGQTGRVEKVQRIRCYVAVAGQDKPVYLFTSDVSASEVQGVESSSSSEALSA